MIPAALAIVTFTVVILLIFKQPRCKIPFTTKHIQIDYGTAPIIGVVILLATFSITPSAVLSGIVGDSVIQPYAILILFMSLAYICLSLDATGLFAYLALRTTKAAGTSGRKLFLYFFVLSSFLTLFTSNDIVILTLTPIIYYFAKSTKTDPIPFLIAQFFAANVWSAALYTGNPTNIIVVQAYNCSFLGYLEWMLLPTVAAGLCCLVLLWLVFRKRIPACVEPQQINPNSALKDKWGAVFGTVCLAACLVCINLYSVLGVAIWQIPLAFSLVVALRDVVAFKFLPKKTNMTSVEVPALVQVLKRMPWKIVPFVIGLFIMVESLIAVGFMDLIASALSKALSEPLSSTFGMGFISSGAANLLSNQPMTILFTRMLQTPGFVVSAQASQASMFSLVLGSNFGANLTLIGSLAGLMWRKLLSDKGVFISFKEFSKYGLLVMPLTVFFGCLTLFLEIILKG